MADLLAKAEALSSRLLGPEPGVAAAADEEAYRVNVESAPPEEPAPVAPEPDPLADRPFRVDIDLVHQLLLDQVPEAAAELGDVGVGMAATLLGHTPREVVSAVDDLGAFSQPHFWALLAAIECNAGESPVATVPPLRVDAGDLVAHAQQHGLPFDHATIAGVSCFIRSLPARVAVGVSRSMACDPAVWELAARAGARMYGIEPK